MRRLAAVVLVFALGCCLSSVLQAQSTNASITGYVTDPSKAVIVEAKVIAINVGTNGRYEVTTNKTGSYTVANLLPGSYRVEVEKEGFKTVVKSDIVLHVQDAVAINFEMAVGSTSEVVTVTGGAPLINTESGAVSTVVDRQFVENLPLNGRSFQSLITITPGVVLTKTNSTGEEGQFSMNGQRADANYFTIDGVSANFSVRPDILSQSGAGSLPGLAVTGGTNSLVSVDAMQEFRIQTSTYAPEFGRTPGGQVQIVTRSGTNQFHGTLFEYFRNDALDASDWFVNANRLSKPAERMNDFGGVFGGPIIKNRTFFFFSYEGLRLHQPQSVVTPVPSVAARQAAPIQIQPLLNAYPIPNGSDLGGGLAQFGASYSAPITLNATSIRVDHTFSPSLSFFGRYNYAPSESTQRGGSPGLSLNDLTTTKFRTQTLTLGVLQSLKSTVSNDFRANYSNFNASSVNALDSLGGAAPPSDSVLFPSFASSQDSVFALVLIGGRFVIVGKNVDNKQRQLNLVDNLSLSKGAHQLKFGVDYRWLSPISSPKKYQQNLIFLGIGLTAPGVPAPPGTLLSGRALVAQVRAFQSVALVTNNFSTYAQDTWRISSRLTLTYGLRWELNPAPRGKNGKDLFTVQGLDNPATMTLAPQGTPLYKTTYANFAPRAGLAFRPFQSTKRESVLRGGFGIFYDLGYGSLSNGANFFPYTNLKTLPGVPFPLTPSQATPLPLAASPPVSLIYVADPNLELPRTYQWNVALEQSLSPNQAVSASYVAAAGRRFLRAEQLLNPNPSFSQVDITGNTASSDYHALQLQYRRRLSRSLQALVSYTWAHSIDIASNNTADNPSASFIDPKIDRGSSDFDVRHAFSGAVTYNIPAPASGFVKSIVGNWAIDSVIAARSATPVDLIGKVNITGFSSVLRPDLVPGAPLYVSDPTVAGGRRFNPAAFNRPVGIQGTLGRNVLRGFSVWQADLSLRREFKLTERWNLQFRADAFNLFNHPNFGDPGTNFNGTNNITNPLFGQATQMFGASLGSGGASGGFNPLFQIGGPRSIQLSLKLNF